jgi:branched-chain amino acid transport system ATP-binding protein
VPTAATSEPRVTGIGLRAERVRISYGAVEVLHGVSVVARPGSVTALVGVNGAGKTTLMKGLMGLLAREGEITLSDGAKTHRIDRLRGHQVARLGVSLVPEGRGMLPDMTVAENLETGGYLLRGRQARRARVDEMMQRLPRLGERRDQLAGTLSGGEQQMLAIGRALMSAPRLLLLDEPSLGLAPVIIRDVVEMIEGIARQGTTIMLVEQNTRIALRLASYVYVIENGRVGFEGTPEQLSESADLASLYLGGTAGRTT